MTNWTFNPADYTESTFSIVPVGDHRVRISGVEEKTFRSGSNGYEITLDVSGYSSKLWYYLVLDPYDPKKTNQRIGGFFDSFGITDYNMSHYRNWIGKVGAVRVKHEEYNGSEQAKVAFCLAKKKQDNLPAWKENSTATSSVNNYSTVNITDDELPFDLP